MSLAPCHSPRADVWDQGLTDRLLSYALGPPPVGFPASDDMKASTTSGLVDEIDPFHPSTASMQRVASPTRLMTSSSCKTCTTGPTIRPGLKAFQVKEGAAYGSAGSCSPFTVTSIVTSCPAIPIVPTVTERWFREVCNSGQGSLGLPPTLTVTETPQPGITLPPGASIPLSILLPPGISLPLGLSLPSGIVLPTGLSLPPGIPLPSGISLPSILPSLGLPPLIPSGG